MVREKEQERKSARVLEAPETNSRVKERERSLDICAHHRSKCAEGHVDEMEPFVHQLTAVLLSDPQRILSWEPGEI